MNSETQKPSEQAERLLLPEEVADDLRCSTRTIDRLCRKKKLGYIVIDDRGTRRFTRAQIQAFIESQSIEPPQPVDKAATDALPYYPKPTGKGGDRTRSRESLASLRREMRTL